MKFAALQAAPRRSFIPTVLLAVALLAPGCGGDTVDDTPDGGTGGSTGGAGGAGGSPDFVGCQEDCAAIETGACEMAVCNDGSHPGDVGACVIVALDNDTPCDDGLFCTVGDVCVDGQCIGPEARDCTGGDTCSTGTCDEETDSCVLAPVADGTPCDDGLFCTTDDSCSGGVCGGVPMDCGEDTACASYYCDEGAERCLMEPINDEQPCDDGLFCTVNETCRLGVCTGGEPNDCGMAPSSECMVVSCDEEAQACSETEGNEGQSCANDNLCQIASTCRSGACVGVDKNCAIWDSACTKGVCDPSDGQCKAQPGTPGVACGDPAGCSTGVCAADGNCMLDFEPDGSACTPIGDCDQGTCFAGSCWEAHSCTGTTTIQLANVTPPNASAGLPWFFQPTVVGGSQHLKWTVVNGTNHHWLALEPTSGALIGVPTEAEIGITEVTLRVEDLKSPGERAERTYRFGVLEVLLIEDFENCDPAGWTLAGDWECGAPSAGPSGAFRGNNVIATNLAGNYSVSVSWGNGYAQTPEIDLTNARVPEVRFAVWHDTESGFDCWNVKLSVDGGPFSVLTMTPGYTHTMNGQSCWSGTHGGYHEFSANLAAYAGRKIRLRFDLQSDIIVPHLGMYIDDFTILH